MKALTLSHKELTREALLRKAEEIPGAWVGIRIAVFLLMLAGWKSTQGCQRLWIEPMGCREVDSEGQQGGDWSN